MKNVVENHNILSWIEMKKKYLGGKGIDNLIYNYLQLVTLLNINVVITY